MVESQTVNDSAVAIKQLLQAEQDALAAVTECEQQAQTLLAQARHRARRIVRRAQARSQRIHASRQTRIERMMAALENAMSASELITTNAPKTESEQFDDAVRALADELLGIAPEQA